MTGRWKVEPMKKGLSSRFRLPDADARLFWLETVKNGERAEVGVISAGAPLRCCAPAL